MNLKMLVSDRMPDPPSGAFSFLSFGLALATMAVSACSGGDLPMVGPDDESPLSALCQEIQADLVGAAAKDAIPALTDPELVAVDDLRAEFLLPTDRVIGIEVDGQYIAIPHNILWWHEIVNFNAYGLAVTYCPLTGSSMVFQRASVDGNEFGVSGLLFNNNLVMYNRTPVGVEETLWPQMLAGGVCGPASGTQLAMSPSLEIEWADWVALHPDTRVVGGDTGFPRDYQLYPYGGYEVESNSITLVPQDDLDRRRPPKERVLGIPFGDGGGIAFPFGALRSVGDLAAIHAILGDGQEGVGGIDPVVVFWSSAAAAAMAFTPSLAGRRLTFEVRNGAFVDVETGSQWSLDGKALTGPLAGESLWKIRDAYVSFWFAFATFFPDPVLWTPATSS